MNFTQEHLIGRVDFVQFYDARNKMAKCPFHKDSKASMSVDVAKGLWHCFVCDVGGDPVDFIARRDGCSAEEAIDKLKERSGVGKKPKPELRLAKDTPVATYDYPQGDSTPYLRKLRFPNHADGKKNMRWEHWTGAGWKSGAANRDQPLYRLSQLLAADPTEPVYVVEGEKAADRLAVHGAIVTTAGGAGGWKPHHADQFPAEREVFILPDNDEAGRRYARTVAAALIGKSKSVRVVTLPELADKADVFDFLDAGHTLEELLLLAANTPLWKSPSAADGADLLAEVEAFFRRFLVLTDSQFHILALWVFHTYAIEAAEATPYLAVTSPDKGTGKTRVLECLEILVRGAFRVVSPSESVVFRQIQSEPTTMLLDEIDAIFGKKQTETEGLRGILNAGYRRGAMIPRVNMDRKTGSKIEKFETFCPKVFCGIGTLPETLADRSIQIRMKKRFEDEKVERFKFRRVRTEMTNLRERIEAWVESRIGAFKDAAEPPEVGGSISDRMEEVAEPLLVIADSIGIGAKARAALLELCTSEAAEDTSIGNRLLADIRKVFGNCSGKEKMTSNELLRLLTAIESSPWGTWQRQAFPMPPQALGRLLKPYGIRSKQMRDEEGHNVQGFKREQFEDAWKRYLPPDVEETDPGFAEENGMQGTAMG